LPQLKINVIILEDISFGNRGGVHSVFKDKHENSVGISMQNVFKPARYNRDNG